MTISHPLQSPAWGNFRKVMGLDVARIHGWQLTFHTIPYTPWTIGYFPKGPKPTDNMLNILKTLGKQKNAIFIQLEPNVTINSRYSVIDSQSLKRSHHPLFTKYTFVLDLTRSEEVLLKAMHAKTRYNLKIARKHGVIVQEDNSEHAFEEYLRLSEETTKRQRFYAHNRTYHRTLWHSMRNAGIAHLFTATYQGKTLAAWIIFAYKKTLYYPYGASSRDYREVMAPTLLLWEIALWGKKNGFTSFDLWGSLGPNPDPRDPWYGFHRFKQGFAPTIVEFIGSYDLVIHPTLYRIYKVANTLRWLFLSLRR